jgi:hypothetical protein
MKLASKNAFVLMLTGALFSVTINQASASPVPSSVIAPQSFVMPIACKYGSGKCANVKPVQAAPSTEKHGPQDPTVDPDCAHYNNCHGGNPEGGSASAKGTSGTGSKGIPPTAVKSSTPTSKGK